MMGKNFTLETMSTTANALAYLYTLKKAVEDEIRGKYMIKLFNQRFFKTELNITNC